MNDKVKDWEYVAVYGSLKKGFGNHRLLGATSEFIGTGITEPKYKMYSLGGFPGLHSGNDRIFVEVYLVDANKTLPNLDLLEGHPSWYKRTLESIIISPDLKIEAWLYTFCHNNSFDTTYREAVEPSITIWE